MKQVVLASASPRRRELLSEITENFIIEPSNADETVSGDVNIDDIPEFLALLKASDVAKNHKDDIVIGSDTIVVVDDKVLNKPKDKDDAFNMLKMLSGRKHRVLTGCAIVCGDKTHSFCEETQVEFYELNDNEINDYIATNDPMDKAGAYGIQTHGKLLVKAIYGDFYNVVGLPVARLKRELSSFLSGE